MALFDNDEAVALNASGYNLQRFGQVRNCMLQDVSGWGQIFV